MIRHEQLRPMVGLIALGVLAVVAVVAVHQSTGPVALESIANLQPQPAELSLKPLGFKVAKESILEDVKQFSVCVNEASTVDEGVWCLSQLIALLPRPLERRATEVAKEIASTRTPTNDPKLLAVRLESCLTAAMERDGAIYCVSELLAQIPPTALAKAIEMGEEHPAFPWKMAHESAVNDAATFETCATEATDEDQGSKCIGELLAQLPEAMVERAVRVAMELPAPGGSPTEPKAVAGKLHECLEVADGRDAASFCLVDFLLSIPQGQGRASVSAVPTPRWNLRALGLGLQGGSVVRGSVV
ncbi:hypothetical protein T484DRAFT_1957219, partial [Baffinella frigidus]